MPIEPEDRQRLADLMDERRQELDKLWQDVAKDGGISLKALHTARTGGSGIRPSTRRGIEKGLRWERTSVDRILNGEDPVALAPQPAPDLHLVSPLGGTVVTIPDPESGKDISFALFGDQEHTIWSLTDFSPMKRISIILELRAERAPGEARRGAITGLAAAFPLP